MLALRASTEINEAEVIWECFGVCDIMESSVSTPSFAGPVRLLGHDCIPNCYVSGGCLVISYY